MTWPTLEEPWWWIFAPPVLFLYWWACRREHSIPKGVWGFLCPPAEKGASLGRERSFQPLAFALLCAGLCSGLALLSQPTWPKTLKVLCMQGRALKNFTDGEQAQWLKRLQHYADEVSNLEAESPMNQHTLSPTSNPTRKARLAIEFIHPDGRAFTQLDELKLQLKESDYAQILPPQFFINDDGPKLIASDWMNARWENHPTLSYLSMTDTIEISSRPQATQILMRLPQASDCASVTCGLQVTQLTSDQQHGQEAVLMPWSGASIVFKNELDKNILALDLTPAPQAHLFIQTSLKLSESLRSACEQYKLWEPRTLTLVNQQSKYRPSDLLSQKANEENITWEFWHDPQHLTDGLVELPTGLPRILQTSSRLEHPILHASMDWPILSLPRLAFAQREHPLVSLQGFSLVQWQQPNTMAWMISPKSEQEHDFWNLLLAESFPIHSETWKSVDTLEPRLERCKNFRERWSWLQQVLLCCSATLLSYLGLHFRNRP